MIHNFIADDKTRLERSQSKFSPKPYNFLKEYPTPRSALVEFLECEKKAAIAKRRQCEEFIVCSEGFHNDKTTDAEVRQTIYNLRKKADEEQSILKNLIGVLR